MKPVSEMTSSERAAALLIAMGKETAVSVFKHLDEKDVVKITTEMAKIEKLSAEDKEDLLADFLIELKKIKKTSFGGENVAKQILSGAFGDKRAAEIYKKADEGQIEGKFDFLNKVEPEIINTLISSEHPQIISLVLSYIEKSKAAQVFKLLDKTKATEVAKRIAKMDRVVPEAVLEISRKIRKKFDEMIQDNSFNDKPGGVSKLAQILNHIDGVTEKTIMDFFESEMPKEAVEIRNKIYTFDNLIDISNKEIRILIDEIGDDELIARALKGAGDEIRFKILRNVSNNRAADILTAIDLMGPIRLVDIMEARQRIVNVMRRLNDMGAIIIRRGDEKLVE